MSQGYSPTPQVAGVCHTAKQKLRGKGKEKENLSIEKPKKRSQPINLDDNEELLHKTKNGCPQGANNYSVGDTNMLLDCVQDELPLGQQGWMAVTTRFNKWAAQSGRPEWKQTSLEMKFKQVGGCCDIRLSLPIPSTSTACENPKANWNGCLPPRCQTCPPH